MGGGDVYVREGRVRANGRGLRWGLLRHGEPEVGLRVRTSVFGRLFFGGTYGAWCREAKITLSRCTELLDS